jgi:hypothetical protein
LACARSLTLCCGPAQEIFRFLKNPRKPAILAMSRPDAKKNITTLVKAFGENPTLRELANLVLIMVSCLAWPAESAAGVQAASGGNAHVV